MFNLLNHIKHTIPSKSLLILLSLSILLLAACNRNEPTPTPTPAAQQEGGSASTPVAAATDAVEPTPAATVAPTPTPLTGRITLWHSWAQAEGDALAALLEQLKTAHPNIQVDTLFVAPDELVSSYAAAVAAGSGPDLILAPNWWLGDLIGANAILNLDAYVGGNLDASYWPAAVASMRYQGSLYGFPLAYSTVALYVNTALVPAEGIPTDTNALLTAASANPTSGLGLYATLFHTSWGFPAYGAQLLDDQQRAVFDQSPGSAEFLTWINALNNTPGSYVSSDYGMLMDRFKKGEFAYFIDGPWALADLRNTFGDELAIAPLPAGPAGPAKPWLYSDGLFVNPTISPEQQTIALNVALFFSSDQAGSTLAAIGNLLPAARNADLADTPLLQGFAQQAENTIAMPISPAMNDIWTYGSDMIIKSITGVAEPATIVAETATLINEAAGQ